MLGNIALPYTAKLKQARNRKKENFLHEHFNSTESEITAPNILILNTLVATQVTDSPDITIICVGQVFNTFPGRNF